MTRKPHTLRLTVFLTVGVMLAVFVAAFFLLFKKPMLEMLLKSEEHALLAEYSMTMELFDKAREDTAALAYDYAMREETAECIDAKTPDFFANNWPGSALLKNYQRNLLVLADASGVHKYLHYYDIDADKEIAVPDELLEALQALGERTRREYDPAKAGMLEQGIEGILIQDGRAYHLCAMPVMRSRTDNTLAGTLIFGNVLDSAYFLRITRNASATFALRELPSAAPPSALQIELVDDTNVAISTALADITGAPLLLTITQPRNIYMGGQQIISATATMLAATLIVFMMLIYTLLHLRIIRPVERMSADMEYAAHAGKIDTGKYSSAREFVTLGTSINAMLEALTQTNISVSALNRILDSMNAGVYVTDIETDEVLFINDNLMQDFHLTGDVIGQKCYKLFHEDAIERCTHCPINQLQSAPDKMIVWESFNPLSGRYCRNTDCLIEWTDKRPAHLQHAVDITEVRQAEAALRRQLAQQELMSTISHSFLTTADRSLLIENALKMAGEFMGLSRILITRINEETCVMEPAFLWDCDGNTNTAFTGAALYDTFIKGATAHIVYEDIRGVNALKVLQDEGVLSLLAVPLFTHSTVSGSLCFLERKTIRTWSESDTHLATLIGTVICAALARHQTEEDLHRMSSIVNSSPSFVAYVNIYGEFAYFNNGALDITGYSAVELMENGIGLLLDPKTAEWIHAQIIPNVLKKSRQSNEIPIIRKDGKRRIMLVSAFMTDEEHLGIGLIASDITEIRELERALVDAKNLAEQSSSAKSEFLSRMSHEMRTPLSAIIGMMNVAKASSDIAKKEYCLDKIEDASKHLLGVINDILDMSKIEANKFELLSAPFHFEKMLTRVINVINFRVDEKKQELVVNIDERIPTTIFSDEQRLAQVITNLLANAVKFTPDGGLIWLNAHLLYERDDVLTLQFDIRDTGIGISKEQQSRLFHSFEQADGGIARKYGGTGLGLAISKRIVGLMGGEIWIESDISQGTTVSFTIETQCNHSIAHEHVRNITWDMLRVLVVDDAPEVLTYFNSIAKNLHLSCDTVSNGAKAMHMLESGTYNIVFVDYQTPDTDGIVLMRRLKKFYASQAVVIMASVAEWSEIEEAAKQVGIMHVLHKPLMPSQIIDCINTVLGITSMPIPSGDAPVRNRTGLFAGHTILLAEDVAINREIVLSLLEDTGVQIDCAQNGSEAVRLMLDNPARYDMIFMDIHMPEMDGFEATRRIRALAHPGAKAIPIVAMTANVFREDVEKCLAAGMNDHIGKPVDIDEIIARMEPYLLGK